jgi:hypothetical protein
MNLASVMMRLCRTIGAQPIMVNHDMSDIAAQYD